MRIIRIAKSLYLNILLRFRWLFLNSNLKSQQTFQVHLLVVNNPHYSNLARTCIESFLYFHPASQITVHCDSSTFPSLQKTLRIIRNRRSEQIFLKVVDDSKSWQARKLGIILGLNGTSEIFMDADLRWNGAITSALTKRVTFFVDEGSSNHLKQFLKLDIDDAIPKQATMKNTSFFCWGDVKLDDQQVLQIQSLHNTIHKIGIRSSLPHIKDIERLSEQISLSLVPEIFKIPFGFLKQTDQQFDGLLVESSYFGSSGGRFAIWGNTNRRFFLK